MTGGAGSLTCPNCGNQMTREGIGVGCHTCGLYMGPGGGGCGDGPLMSGLPGGRVESRPNLLFQDIEDFHIHEGSRIGVQLKDGPIVTGTVTHYEEDKDTGEITMTVDPDDPPPGPGFASWPS